MGDENGNGDGFCMGWPNHTKREGKGNWLVMFKYLKEE